MGRRADHSREELYELILATAWELAESDGLAGLTARRIADQIGYTPGTLYNVFEDLDDLITRIRGRTLDAMYEDLAAIERTGDPLADLLGLGQGFLRFIQDNPQLWSVMMEHSLADAEVPDWYHEKAVRLLELVEAALQPLFRAGDDSERKLSAQVLWSSLHGIFEVKNMGKLIGDEPLDEMAGTLITRFVDGLRYQAQQRDANSTF